MSSSFEGNNPSLQIHSFSEDRGKCKKTVNASISDFSTIRVLRVTTEFLLIFLIYQAMKPTDNACPSHAIVYQVACIASGLLLKTVLNGGITNDIVDHGILCRMLSSYVLCMRYSIRYFVWFKLCWPKSPARSHWDSIQQTSVFIAMHNTRFRQRTPLRRPAPRHHCRPQ